ncbi:MAG: GntR family transcriptional regulator [Gemmatimonadales bacterium]|nr:GntR family transcriptional regulator [Gemmatimonadales bacterium]MDX2058875.1 GntR family transcriptional regulator [Gemmatimonadales bacterium]
MTVTKRGAKPATRIDRPKQVYEQLRELIVHGRLAPGSRLVETDIATRFGVSRTPVRGALQRLQQEGYIVDSPSMRQSRPTVAPLTGDDAAELFDIVGQLEALAAANAAALPAPKRQALAKELTTINNEFRKAAQSGRPDHNRLWDLDERFHERCVEVAAGPRLRLLHGSVKPQAERYERLYVSYLAGEIATSVAEHEVIIAAIEQGDATAAKVAVERNWHNAAERLGRVIERVGDRGRW